MQNKSPRYLTGFYSAAAVDFAAALLAAKTADIQYRCGRKETDSEARAYQAQVPEVLFRSMSKEAFFRLS